MITYMIRTSKKISAEELQMIERIAEGKLVLSDTDKEKETIDILKSYAEDINTRPWNGDNRHWYIGFANGIYYDYETLYKRGEIYFASKTDAERAVEAAGKDNVLKYYLKAIR